MFDVTWLLDALDVDPDEVVQPDPGTLLALERLLEGPTDLEASTDDDRWTIDALDLPY